MLFYSRTLGQQIDPNEINIFSEEVRRFVVQHDLQMFQDKAIKDAYLLHLDLVPCVSIYVYGTLRKQCSAHEILSEFILAQDKPFEGFCPNLKCLKSKNPSVEYPAVVYSENESDQVYCERYLVHKNVLDVLNRYEAAPEFYELKPYRDGWIYMLNPVHRQHWSECPDSQVDYLQNFFL